MASKPPSDTPTAVTTTSAPQNLPACAIDPDVECPVCAARGLRVRMHPVKAHYQCPQCRYFDSCCM